MSDVLFFYLIIIVRFQGFYEPRINSRLCYLCSDIAWFYHDYDRCHDQRKTWIINLGVEKS